MADKEFRIIKAMNPDLQEELFVLFQKIFGARKALLFKERFHWQYILNPFKLHHQETNWILVRDGKVVGHFGLIPREIKIGRDIVNTVWGGDFFIDENNRFGKAMVNLYQKWVESSSLILSFGVTQNAKMFPDHFHVKKLNVNSTLIKFIYPKGIFSITSGKDHKSFFIRKVKIVFEKLGYFKNYLTNNFKRNPIISIDAVRIHWVEKFDESFDDLWSKVADEYPISVSREQKYLKWRYRLGPQANSKIIMLSENGTNKAYAIIQKVRWRGTKTIMISELIAEKQNECFVKTLISFIEDVGRRENVDVITTLGHMKKTRAVFEKCGYLSEFNQDNVLLVKDNIDKYGKEFLYNIDNWLITPGDGDHIYGTEMLEWDEKNV